MILVNQRWYLSNKNHRVGNRRKIERYARYSPPQKLFLAAQTEKMAGWKPKTGSFELKNLPPTAKLAGK